MRSDGIRQPQVFSDCQRLPRCLKKIFGPQEVYAESLLEMQFAFGHPDMPRLAKVARCASCDMRRLHCCRTCWSCYRH